MKPVSILPLLAAIACSLFTTAHLHAQGTAFTYQGFLTVQGAPATGTNDFEFKLYNDPAAGAQQGSTVTVNDLAITNGLFTVTLDFGASVFDGSARWLDIAVRPGASVDAYTNLVPRQPITATPYALKAANAMTVAMGTLSDPSFLGTTTTAPLQLQVSNTVGLRLEYPTVGTVPNLVGGFSGNSVGAGTQGAVIAGGGLSGNGNDIGVDSDYSAIGGGVNNNIADNAFYATIAGGGFNDIGENALASMIGGGQQNKISSNSAWATIAGGALNDIGVNSAYSAIGGGRDNNIASNAWYAVIPGGYLNAVGAGATNAFAAGYRAKANHPGTFVWADSQNADFASTTANQFNVRASGGTRIFSNGGLTTGVTLAAGANAWAAVSDRNAKKNFVAVDGLEVLEQLARMPIQRWNYKAEPDDAVPHIGPMAQDFKAAFYPGRDDKSITTMEFDGVALAAIQGLNAKVESGKQKAETRIQKLETENAELKQRLAALEKLMQRLNVVQNGGGE